MLVVCCGLLALAIYASHFVLLWTRTFDPDEFQHLHAAFAVSQGFVPFRDFFEHHMPAIQMMLAPMMRGFDIDRSADDAIAFMFVARLLMAVFAGAAVAVTGMLARQLAGATVGWISIALLSCSIVFLGRTLEIRPDTVALPVWLAALWALAKAVEPSRRSNPNERFIAASGGLFGMALVFNQKLLLAAPGLAIWFLAYLVGSPSRRMRERLTAIVAFACAAALPLFVLASWFWHHDALAAMLRGTLLDNLGWPREMDARTTLAWMAVRDPIVSSLGVAGLVWQGLTTLRTRRADGTAAVWASGVSLLVFLFVTPTPFPQYLLLVIPIGSILGARLLWGMVTALVDKRPLIAGGNGGDAVLVLIFLGAALVLSLTMARPVVLHPLVYPVVALCAVGAALALVKRGLTAGAVTLIVLAAALYPLQQVRWMAGLSNTDQLATMKALHAATTPDARVLDGFSGLAWFRPSANYYGFLHPGVRAFLGADQKKAIVTQLSDCLSAPTLVILDANLRELTPDVVSTVERLYRRGPVSGTWMPAATGVPCGEGR